MSAWFNLQAYAFDKPVEYKKLLIYPALMKNYFEFSILIQSLLIEKNTTLEGISKMYLQYIYFLHDNKDENQWLQKFDALLRLVLRKDDIEISYKREPASFEIDGEVYTSEDFNALRLLICEQNDVEIPDETVQKEIRDSMEEAKRLRAKMSGTIPPTLEDQVNCVMVSTSLNLEEISNLSIRKFGQILERADAKLHYQVYLTASVSGMVEFKDKSILKHWMSGVEKDKWGGTMMSVETLESKLGGSAQNSTK